MKVAILSVHTINLHLNLRPQKIARQPVQPMLFFLSKMPDLSSRKLLPVANQSFSFQSIGSLIQPILRSRWFFAIAAVAALIAAYLGQNFFSARTRAFLGIFCFLSAVIACSTSPRHIRWKQAGMGMALQLLLALLVLKLRIGSSRPIYEFFEWIGQKVQVFLSFTAEGSRFLFGSLADHDPGKSVGIVFAFAVLPTIVFVSASFSVLQHLGILRFLIKGIARVIAWALGTSGAETLSVSASVFLGQTEAPLLVQAFLPRMTQSELLTIMSSGFAHISAAMIAVYISYQADPVGILATGILAVPASLYVSKMMIPEQEQPETKGKFHIQTEAKQHTNLIDAFAAGTSQGLRLAANVGAMLIAFLAMLAMIDYGLKLISGTLSLGKIFSWLFAPIAALLGTPSKDIPVMGELLGLKLAGNEHVAISCLTGKKAGCEAYPSQLLPATKQIAAFALAGFANFASVGIQLGGLGGMAPSRRSDLARLVMRALMVGFLVTLLNACLAVVIGL